MDVAKITHKEKVKLARKLRSKYDRLCAKCGEVIKSCLVESGGEAQSWVCHKGKYYHFYCYYGKRTN